MDYCLKNCVTKQKVKNLLVYLFLLVSVNGIYVKVDNVNERNEEKKSSFDFLSAVAQ